MQILRKIVWADMRTMPTEKGLIMAFWDNFLGGGIEGAAKGLGTLATDIRAAITGKEIQSDETRFKLEEIAKQLEIGEQSIVHAVNATMQTEAKSEHWPQWSWRPFWGFTSALAFVAVAALCCLLAYKAVVGGVPEAMNMIPQLVASFTGLFAIPGAILGVTAWHRGQEKRGK